MHFFAWNTWKLAKFLTSLLISLVNRKKSRMSSSFLYFHFWYVLNNPRRLKKKEKNYELVKIFSLSDDLFTFLWKEDKRICSESSFYLFFSFAALLPSFGLKPLFFSIWLIGGDNEISFIPRLFSLSHNLRSSSFFSPSSRSFELQHVFFSACD